MKKIYMIIAAASVMLAANSCNKENVPTTSSEPMVVKFTASVASTKTAFGDIDTVKKKVPVFWEGGENLDVCVNEHAQAAVQDKIFVEASQDGKTAMWSYDFSKTYGVSTTYKPEAPFTFYAFYPGDQMRAFHSAASKGKDHGIKIQSLPSEQTPKENSCDPKAMFLCSISDTYETWPDAVDMPDFKHMTAYGCITLGQGIPEDETVRKVTITANEGQYLAGTAWYYYADNADDGKAAGEWDNYSASNPSGEAPSETITLITSSKENIWFGCRPTTAMTSLTIGVYTDKGYYEVTKTETELEGKQFVAGVVMVAKITGFKPKEYTYTLDCKTSCPFENVGSGSSFKSKYFCYTADESSNCKGQGENLVWSEEGRVVSENLTIADNGVNIDWNLTATLTNGKYNCYHDKASTYARTRFGTSTTGYVNPLILTADFSDYIVKKISVFASTVKDNSVNITAKVGETEYFSGILAKSVTAIGATGAEYSGTGESSGNVVITLSNVEEDIDDTINLFEIIVEYVDKVTVTE